MSHVAYDLQLSEAMNDLQEQVKVEQVPIDINPNTQRSNIDDPWGKDQVFQHLACLYIKYVDIYRKLEDCYDQMVQPQKRYDIKNVVESTMLRICEIKNMLVEFNPRDGSIYVHLDQLLFDLKYDPSVIEIPVPRYFKDAEDVIPINIVFKEEPDRPGGTKKKATKKKKKGKKKKATADDDEKEEKMTLKKQDEALRQAYKQGLKMEMPDEVGEIVHDVFALHEMVDMEGAIRLIQSNERGRQGVSRIQLIKKIIRKQKKDRETREAMKQGKMALTPQQMEEQASQFLQNRFRGILARKEVEKMRQQEMVFLGMQRSPRTADDDRNDPLKFRGKTMQHSRMRQSDNQKMYEFDKVELQKTILNIEGYERKEKMLGERRDWILKEKEKFTGVKKDPIPQNIEGFYIKEEENDDDDNDDGAAAAEPGAKKGKEKEKEKKGKKGGKKGKGGGAGADAGGEENRYAKVGPNELVRKFDNFYEEYKTKWAGRDESNNHEQKYDRDMARTELIPNVEKELKTTVDAMINAELENMRQLAGTKAKKKKGKKKGKKGGKKKKEKKIKLPGGKQIFGFTDYELLRELVQSSICKYLPKAHIIDFLGEFNYIHSMLDDVEKTPYDPSMALIRQIVTEYIIFPLGSELVRKRHPAKLASIIFYGPEGTGKTLMVRAVASETKAVVFDLSPASIIDKYIGNRADSDKLVAMVFKAAKAYQPSVIYIDEVEKIWPAKKKKKKGVKGPSGKRGDQMNNPQRIKKALIKWRQKWITEDTRITIIGCSNEVHEGSKKDFKKFFDRSIYFPFPDYTTCCRMWKMFIEQRGGWLRSDFPLNTLAHMSRGYSAGSIKKTVEFVLTPYRKDKLTDRPLKISEFIGPLSQCANTEKEMYEEYQTFTDFITGDGRRRLEMERLRAGESVGDEGDGKKKKGKKGKKGK